MASTFDWDPLDPSSIRDPYPIYAELRERHPVYWHAGMSSWVLTRYDDCHRVLRDYATFARDRRRVGEDYPEETMNIQKQDPPEQATLRRLTTKSLNSQKLQEICTEGRDLMEKGLSRLVGAGPFDVMQDLAAPAAMHVINRVFGVDSFTPRSYAPVFEGLTQSMDSGLDPDRNSRGNIANDVLIAEVGSWLAQGLGKEGMLGELYTYCEGLQMSQTYVRNTVAATYNAGFSTLFTSTGTVALEILKAGPEILKDVNTDDGSALILASEELLRYTSPAQATARVATTATTLHGVTIEAGDTVVTMMASANRDPRQFSEPDQIVLDRSPNQHLAFAWGPHICLGARLAQSWIAEVISFLAKFASRLRLCGEEQYMSAATLRNLVALPVEYV